MGPVFVVEGATPVIELSDIAGGDGNISDTERTAGFDIVGDLGFPGTGATVEVSFNDAAGTTVTVIAGSNYGNVGKWTVSVDPSAPEVPSGDATLTVDVSASVGAVSATRQTVIGVGTVTVSDTPTAEWDIEPLTVSVNVGTITPTTFKTITSYVINSGALPLGLNLDPATGEISGTPSEAAAARTVEVMLTADDETTNVVEIVFPAVEGQPQTLTNFAYTPATVEFPDEATTTGPTGAQTALSYTTTDSGVCTVDSDTGAVTPVDAGTCPVTVTATADAKYVEATATATVTITALDGLVNGVAPITVTGIGTDNYINRQEHTDGFTVSGSFGFQDVDVELAFDSLQTLTARTGSSGDWSITVAAASGAAHTYIGGLSDETELVLQAAASRKGYTPATTPPVTVTVDVTAPAGTYTVPAALALGTSVRIFPTRHGDVVMFVLSGDLPSGLMLNNTAGWITGTPDMVSASRSTVTVTLTDNAGNVGEVPLDFPPVGGEMRDLTGFGYSPAEVRYPAGATATPPTVTPALPGSASLAYTTSDDTVCTVDEDTGAVTPLDVGTCTVTVTAPAGGTYVASTATAAVTISESNGLVDGATVIEVTSLGNTDGYINRLEHEMGLTVSGSFGVQGANVALTFDGGQPTTATTGTDGSWSVTLTMGTTYDYIGGLGERVPLTLQAVASRDKYATATTDPLTLTVDLEDPTGSYAVPAELTVGIPVLMPLTAAVDVVKAELGGGLPSGLRFSNTNGGITEAPDMVSASRSTVTVTLTDRAGNTGEVLIDFPPVGGETRALTGFGYSPAEVRFPAEASATAPSVTPALPGGASLAYTTSDTGVCMVNGNTGAVTPLDVGDCRVTVTAPASGAYAASTATATVVILASNDLVVGKTKIAVTSLGNTDGYINRLEHEMGLTVSGSFGVQGANVALTFDGGRMTTATTGTDGSWSVTLTMGTTYDYIGGLGEGDPLTLQAVASRDKYATATTDPLTLTVDLVDPTATYNFPALSVGTSVEINPTESADVSGRSEVTGLPTDLRFDRTDGKILGTPRTVAAAGTVTVTLTDRAGNTGEVDIVFPAVKDSRTLSGFAYSPTTVEFPNSPMLTPPRVTPPLPGSDSLAYTTSDDTVCTVNEDTGAVTPEDVGICRVTVTADESALYAEATATAVVTIEESNGLIDGATVIEVTSLGNTDGYINRLEHEMGLTVSGSFGVEGADVALTFDGGQTTTATPGTDGSWSVTLTMGTTYDYIGGLGERVPLTLQAVASRDKYATATTDPLTLTVDLADPAATYSNIPPLSVGTSVDERPMSQSDDIAMRTISGDLPPGLQFDTGTGRIHGTPREAAPGRTVTVTLTDRAGNTGEAEIEFPPVKDSQRLSGFAYTPAQVTFPNGATATPPTASPPGAQAVLALSYTTSDSVCRVASDGAVTPVDAGTCRVTVTAAESTLYAEATATATVTIEALGGLGTNATLTVAGNTDGYINRAEYESTLTVEGEFGVEGVDVELIFDGGRPLTTQTAPDGTTWSVEVTTGTDAHTYIGQISEEAGSPLMLRAIASKAGYSDAVVGLTLTVDLMDPEVMYSIPALAVGASVDIGPTRESADVSTRSMVTGLPADLSFDPDTGRISGTPDGLAVAGAVTVTLTDNAGNVGESEIVFEAVGKGMQTLSGFAYSPSRVTVSTDTTVVQEVTVTLTAPTGAQTGPLSYATADDGTVCTVTESGTGAGSVSLAPPLVAGTFCRVTVTAPDGTDYLEAAATATIRIVAPGLTSEEQEEVTEVVLSEVGGIAAIQAVDVIGARLGASGAGTAGSGFSLQVGAAHLESVRLERERAEQMAGWTELASRDDFDRAMLGRSSFSLGSGGEGAAWTLWGQGAYREYERKEGGVETDGDVLSGFVGLDFDRGRLRHGLAVGRSWGDGSFSAGEEESKKGTYELDLTSGYYYLRGRTDFGSLWGMLGAGTGEIRIVNGDQRTAQDLTMQTAAAGAEVELRKGSDFDLSARAEGMIARLESEDALVAGADRVLDGGEYGSQRLRAALEASREIDFESGARVRPSLEAGARYDGGDGVEGVGLELGGGMELAIGNLTTELHATWLAAHREDLEEWGASVSARYGLGGSGRHGLWLGVEAAGGLERGALGLDRAGDPGAWLRDSEESDGDDDAGGLFSAEAGYGIGVRSLGLTTPFVRFSSDSSSRRTFSQGLRLRLGGGWLDAEFAGSRSRGGGEDDDYSYGIELQARF